MLIINISTNIIISNYTWTNEIMTHFNFLSFILSTKENYHLVAKCTYSGLSCYPIMFLMTHVPGLFLPISMPVSTEMLCLCRIESDWAAQAGFSSSTFNKLQLDTALSFSKGNLKVVCLIAEKWSICMQNTSTPTKLLNSLTLSKHET